MNTEPNPTRLSSLGYPKSGIPQRRLDSKVISAIKPMPSQSRPKLSVCLKGLIKTLAPFDIAPLDPKSSEDKYRLALPWIRSEAGKIHALCSILGYMSPREKGAERTRYLLFNLSEITLLIHKLCNPVDSKSV
jgi:hypothetical protein